jgi:hypothetical protein
MDSIRRLRPGEWVNDELFYIVLCSLQKRAYTLSLNDTFIQSLLSTKLFPEEGKSWHPTNRN